MGHPGDSARAFKSERQAWNFLNGTGRRRAIRRGKLRRAFKAMKQHKELIPRILALVGSHLAGGDRIHPRSKVRYLADIHPDAMPFLRRFGREYKGIRWLQPPEVDPRPSQCFWNATVAMHNACKVRKRTQVKKVELVYVEGVAHGPWADPMPHAWNAKSIGSKHAWDWTFYTLNHRTFYFGIPFSYQEYQQLCRVVHPKRKVLPLFRKETFSIRLKVEMLDILVRRKRASKKLPKRAAR